MVYTLTFFSQFQIWKYEKMVINQQIFRQMRVNPTFQHDACTGATMINKWDKPTNIQDVLYHDPPSPNDRRNSSSWER